MKTRAMLVALIAAAINFASGAAAASASSQKTLEVSSLVTPNFPFQLTQRGVLSGEASAVVSLKADGTAADWLVTSYTDPAFVGMTGDVLENIVFKLPEDVSARAPVRTTLRLSYEATGVVISQMISDTIDLQITRFQTPRRIEMLGTLRDLDRMPTVQRAVSPRLPAGTVINSGTKVTLEFLIDETGHVRMPVLCDEADRQLADAAASALLAWQFTPPTRKGKPVIVAARQEFVFSPQP